MPVPVHQSTSPIKAPVSAPLLIPRKNVYVYVFMIPSPHDTHVHVELSKKLRKYKMQRNEEISKSNDIWYDF